MINGPTSEWMDQWQALSRQYWNAWQDLTREAGAASGRDTAATPWHEGFEQWARMFGGTGPQSETIERVLASARSFTAFAQSMIAAAAASGHGGVPDWSAALRDGFKIPGTESLFANPLAQALREISGQGVKSFEQMMKGMSPDIMKAFNPDLMKGFAPEMDPAREMRSWLRVPAFGFLREHQEHYQKMAVAFLDYQEQTNRYNALIMQASRRGFELFESKLAAREEPGRQIDSLRALYDLWVDAAEEAYAEIALSPEFREVYGALVNAQMRVRSQIQQEVERIATDFGMPTRSELDSIGQRLHDLRRELRNSGRAADGDLAREVESLRREVAALKAAVRGRDSAASASPAKSTQASATAKKSAKSARAHRRPAKSAKPVAALRAEVKETVKASPSVATTPADKKLRAPKSPAPRARAKARPSTHAQRPKTSVPRAKKSVAKVAHRPSRVGHPVASFADRIAAFARAATKSRAPITTPHGRASQTKTRHGARNGGR